MCVMWLVYMCDVYRQCVRRDSFICETTHPYVCHAQLYIEFFGILLIESIAKWRLRFWMCDVQMCDMTHSYVWRDSFICVTWLILCVFTLLPQLRWHDCFTRVWRDLFICDVTYSHAWRDSFICVTWLIPRVFTPLTQLRWHDSFTYVTWLIHMWRDLFTCVTWLIHMCDMTHLLYLHPNPSTKVIWLIHMCDVTHSYVTWLIHMRDVTHSYVWHDLSFVSSPYSLN